MPTETAADPSVRPLPRKAIVACGLGVGVAGDLLLRDASGPGLNLLLLFALLAGAVTLVTRSAGTRLSREAWLWMATGLLFAASITLRGAPNLQFIAFLAASAAFALPALRGGAAWLRRSGVGDHAEAIAGAVLNAGFGSLRLMAGPDAGAQPLGGDPKPAWAVLRGLLVAVPLLLLFGGLFISADPVFHGLVTGLLDEATLEVIVGRALLVGALAWLASGYLAGFVRGTRLRDRTPASLERPSTGIVEVGTVLGLLALLFAVFVAVQLRYLFGGSALVEVTPGLTYSAYAREGFAQLVVAAGLVLPILLASDWLLRREPARDAKRFRALAGVLVLLLLVVIASAFQRVRVYQEAYGLTESRLYGVAVLLWLTLVTAWLAATVLRGRREHFAGAAVVSAFVLGGGLVLANPDDLIARSNLARAEVDSPRAEVDAAYLGTLGPDAVPVLLGALPGLSPDARCVLGEALERRWGVDAAHPDWRSWNRSEARARRHVSEAGAAGPLTRGCPSAEATTDSEGGPARD